MRFPSKRVFSSKTVNFGEVLELVEQAGLENRCILTGTVGSNPTLSAIE